jgi:hypothetical protein
VAVHPGGGRASGLIAYSQPTPPTTSTSNAATTSPRRTLGGSWLTTPD